MEEYNIGYGIISLTICKSTGHLDIFTLKLRIPMKPKCQNRSETTAHRDREGICHTYNQ